jgi:hypothetical protein
MVVHELVCLYESWGEADEAAKWRVQLPDTRDAGE